MNVSANFLETQNPSNNFYSYSSVRSFCQWLGATSGFIIENSLEVGAFFLQFLEWFYSSNTTKSKLFAADAIPPFPALVSFTCWSFHFQVLCALGNALVVTYRVAFSRCVTASCLNQLQLNYLYTCQRVPGSTSTGELTSLKVA